MDIQPHPKNRHKIVVQFDSFEERQDFALNAPPFSREVLKALVASVGLGYRTEHFPMKATLPRQVIARVGGNLMSGLAITSSEEVLEKDQKMLGTIATYLGGGSLEPFGWQQIEQGHD